MNLINRKRKRTREKTRCKERRKRRNKREIKQANQKVITPDINRGGNGP